MADTPLCSSNHFWSRTGEGALGARAMAVFGLCGGEAPALVDEKPWTCAARGLSAACAGNANARRARGLLACGTCPAPPGGAGDCGGDGDRAEFIDRHSDDRDEAGVSSSTLPTLLAARLLGALPAAAAGPFASAPIKRDRCKDARLATLSFRRRLSPLTMLPHSTSSLPYVSAELALQTESRSHGLCGVERAAFPSAHRLSSR